MVRRSDDQQEQGHGVMEDPAAKDGWQRTVEDMRAMAVDRQDRGFDTMTIASGDTTTLGPKAETDRFGFSHLIPSNQVEEFEEFYASGDYTDTGVYQVADSGNVLMVTEHIDYDNERVVYVAGAFRMSEAAGLVRGAMDRGYLHTYVRTLDQSVLGTFDHDDPSAFFPDPQRYYSYEPNV